MANANETSETGAEAGQAPTGQAPTGQAPTDRAAADQAGAAMPGRSVTRLTDPRALRAYAHPVRMKLVGLLRTEGPLTATRAAELLGESSGTCSFHLRQLAKYGLVEEAGGGTGREKPWRATATTTSWDAIGDTPEVAAAASMLNTAMAEQYFEQLMRWLEARPGEPGRVAGVVPVRRPDPLRHRRGTGRTRPPGARSGRGVLRAPGQTGAAAAGIASGQLPEPGLPQRLQGQEVVT